MRFSLIDKAAKKRVNNSYSHLCQSPYSFSVDGLVEFLFCSGQTVLGSLIAAETSQYGLSLGQTGKKPQGCLEIFSPGRSQGKADCPEGYSPEGQSDYPRDLLWEIFLENSQAFPLFVKSMGFNTEEDAA